MSPLELTLLYLLAAVLGVVVCRSFKLPPMLGYLAVGVVIGARNLINSKSRSRRSTPKLTHKDKGIVVGHNGGINRARAALQNELSTKRTSHH